MENLYKPDCIRTHSGLYMNVFETTPGMICIEDIAHALSHQCRFAGHLPQFYSVAQHSHLCYQNLPEHLQLQGLLHDASEAYLMDIPSPIKARLPEYKKIEDNLMRMIADKFGFDYPLHPKTKLIDHTMLILEWNHLMLSQPICPEIVCWEPGYANGKFLIAFHTLQQTKN